MLFGEPGHGRAAATAVIWTKDPTEDSAANRAGWLAEATTTIVGLLALFTILSTAQMFYRLHTPTPEAANLKLRAGKGKAVAEVPEFFVAGDSVPAMPKGVGGSSSLQAAAAKGRGPPDESSSLLCMERPGKGPPS